MSLVRRDRLGLNSQHLLIDMMLIEKNERLNEWIKRNLLL